MKNVFYCLCLLGCAGLSAQTTPVLKCDRMDVLYVGVDNPLSLYLPAVQWDSLEVGISDGTIEHTSDNHYIARVSKPGQADISVRLGGRMLAGFSLRVKRVPDPVPMLSGASLRKNTNLSAVEFQQVRGLGMLLENFDFDARCSAVQFDLTRVDSAGRRNTVHNLGARFEEPARKLAAQAASGDLFLFSDIEVNCAREERNRTLSNYAILVK